MLRDQVYGRAMNILQFSTAADTGGAGVAMARLHRALIDQGHRSRIVARLRKAPQADVLTVSEAVGAGHSLAHRLFNNIRMQVDAWFVRPQLYDSTQRILRSDLFEQADVIQLHNLHSWYFNYELLPQIAARKPVVWTLHDMWAFTGHCAYSYGCERWQAGCYHCPLLRGSGRRLVEPRPTLIDRTAQQWHKKRDLYGISRLHIVTPSMWLADQVQRSILSGALSIECIPYGLDLDLYHPVEQGVARQRWGIPADVRVILFVAANVRQKRKGLVYLLDALRRVDSPESTFLLAIGGKPMPEQELAGFRHIHLGHLSDESTLNLAYNAADLFVSPALADNLPLVVMESLASGTPVVAFDVGGIPEMIAHLDTGYLARYQDATDLAAGISTILSDDALRSHMRERCREAAIARYDLQDQARRYVELYERAIRTHRQRESGN
jgi:glycosyltransferase involved in cell wall biosynthesis